jgi:hypothetical protein
VNYEKIPCRFRDADFILISVIARAALVLSSACIAFAAAPSAIGVATASGHFSVEGSQVWGNATLFDGSAVETGAASSELSLRNGVKVQLGADSRAHVWRDRLVLEKGVGQVAASSPFEVGASGFTIQADGARVRVALGRDVEVATLAGRALVTNAAGSVLASIPAGGNRSFMMQASVTHAGCMVFKDGYFLLQDQATQEVIQLNGPDLAANVGNRVEIGGTASTARPAVAVATSVLNVTSVAPRAQGGCLSVAAALSARTDVPGNIAPAPAKPAAPGTPPQTPRPASSGGGGLSAGAKVGIVAAIGGGAGAGIYYATKKNSTSP